MGVLARAWPALLLSLFVGGALAQGQPPTRRTQSACYNDANVPQRCIPEFENAAFGVLMEATNTCGENGDTKYCTQQSTSIRKSCDICRKNQFQAYFLTDLHRETENQTWWQSETMNEDIQYPYQVNLTLNLGKAFDITYVRVVFYSPRPESFAIYKRTTQDSEWEPYQYYSATCRDTYNLPDLLPNTDYISSLDKGSETRALCTSEYSDISPLSGGNVAFSTLERRPSAYNFDSSPELQEWVTATDIRITLDRLNTFGDETWRDEAVLQSYWYAISDVAVGARCKCNGHASKCEVKEENGVLRRVCQCEHNTAGPDCNKCKDFYNDSPWGRASQNHVHECQACNCNGYSDRCFFDQELYDRTGHGGHCMNCTENRDGPNCERCKENFYEPEDYICTPCDCDPIGSRSLQCNSDGKCQCKQGVTGDKCDRCAPNHYEFTASGCKLCDCSEAGSYGNRPMCDDVTGVCRCKDHVEGKRCKQCKPGYFNLDIENEYGCTPCFCYGHSADCKSAIGYAKVNTESMFSRNPEKWTAKDDQYRSFPLQYNPSVQNIAISADGGERIYFSAPDHYLGDQRSSYNHDLQFTLRLGDNCEASASQSDIILEGFGTFVSIPIFGQRNSVPSRDTMEYKFRLHEHPDFGWSPKVSSKVFMSILSNLTAIKIRGTYCNRGVGMLDNVRLETVQLGAAGQPALWVEMCSCPAGYVGQFCESCAPGYRHKPALGGPFKPCTPCNCNGHAAICDSETGRCICEDNTSGDNCELCARGFYGNALQGTQNDCFRCPCPNNGACIQMANKEIVCTECPTGYAGFKCDICSDGYFGDPTGSFGPVQFCKPCDCNGNVDSNAVGNCNHTTGECLKCRYYTAGPHCEQCLPGYFGDALSLGKTDCKPCDCNPQGTMEKDGISLCNPVTGQCSCRPNVMGKNCDKCLPGFFNIASGEGCQDCECNLVGSYNQTCDIRSGQCFCKPGVTGNQCNDCAINQYGFSSEGCKECMCDIFGSTALQCNSEGQCPCYDSIEGLRCDRCKENKHNRQSGCIDCKPCYNLVQDAVNIHRRKLEQLEQLLRNIEKNPTVISNSGFDNQLAALKNEIKKLSRQAKEGTSVDGEKSLVERLNDLNTVLTSIGRNMWKIDSDTMSAKVLALQGMSNYTNAKQIIEASRKELDNALDYIKNDGSAALAKARNSSDQFGQQSKHMSNIAQESMQANVKLQKEAKNIKDIATSANVTSTAVSRIAKDGLKQQANITNELKTLASEINTAAAKLKNVQEMVNQSLNISERAYEDALDTQKHVESTSVPKIDVQDISEKASGMTSEAEKIQGKVTNLMEENAKTLEDLQNQVETAKILLEDGNKQQQQIADILMELDLINSQAENAVNQSNTTLTEAQKIYKTLKEFHNQVETSHMDAINALKNITQIEELIGKARELTWQVTNNLQEAEENAQLAWNTSKEAHDKYAVKASEEASEIKSKAATIRMDANTLLVEANQLLERIAESRNKIGKIEKEDKDHGSQTQLAKNKVGLAKTEAMQTMKLVKKALREVDDIKKSLKSLQIVDESTLEVLAVHLANAEQELKMANLSSQLQKLQDMRNVHTKWIKDYSEEASSLESKVENVKNILKSLPEHCFKKEELESMQ